MNQRVTTGKTIEIGLMQRLLKLRINIFNLWSHAFLHLCKSTIIFVNADRLRFA